MKVLDKLISKTIYRAFEEYLIDLRIEEKSPKTLRFYRQFITPFINFVGEDKQLSEISSTEVKEYFLKHQTDNHPYSYNARYRGLRAFFNWAIKQHYLRENPLTFSIPRLPEVTIPIFSDSDIKAMIKVCNDKFALRDRAVILALFDTGMRVGEMVRMKLENIDIDARIIEVKGKGKKVRKLRVSSATLKAIWAYLKSLPEVSEQVWLSEEGKPLTESGIAQIIRKVSRRAGTTGVRASPHTFRHTFACNFLENGGDSLDLQYLLGHSSLKMVERYSRATKARRALKAHERFSPVDRLGLR